MKKKPENYAAPASRCAPLFPTNPNKNLYIEVFGVADWECIIRYPKFKMTNPTNEIFRIIRILVVSGFCYILFTMKFQKTIVFCAQTQRYLAELTRPESFFFICLVAA